MIGADAVEHLAAPVEDEVVVRGDEGEGDGQRSAELASGRTIDIIPRQPTLYLMSCRTYFDAQQCRRYGQKNRDQASRLIFEQAAS